MRTYKELLAEVIAADLAREQQGQAQEDGQGVLDVSG
jgi:hypothetical protein